MAKYNKEVFENLTHKRKLEVIQEELQLETHNGTTKDDLLMLLNYTYNRCISMNGMR